MFGAELVHAERFWNRARRRRYLVYAVVGGGLLGLSALAQWRDDHALLINATTSLPNWAFVIDKSRVPVRGDLIFFDPPRSALLERHFGREPSPFGKIVYGVGGDRIEARDRVFLVNGRPVALAKFETRLGEPLAAGPTGTLPRGCYFVATPHRDSLDSRYAAIGWICRPRVIGVGKAIL